MEKMLFHKIVAELVDRKRRINSEKRDYIAYKLNVSEQYLRKIHSLSTDKRYSLEHLYLLSNHWGISISELIPSVSNLKLLPRYQEFTDEDLEREIEKINENLMGEDDE